MRVLSSLLVLLLLSLLLRKLPKSEITWFLLARTTRLRWTMDWTGLKIKCLQLHHLQHWKLPSFWMQHWHANKPCSKGFGKQKWVIMQFWQFGNLAIWGSSVFLELFKGSYRLVIIAFWIFDHVSWELKSWTFLDFSCRIWFWISIFPVIKMGGKSYIFAHFPVEYIVKMSSKIRFLFRYFPV